MTPGPTPIDAWLVRQANRERGIVRLEDALLGGRFARYFAYRLRFFAIRYVVASVVQLAKVLILHRLLEPVGFVTVVALVAAAGLLSGAWWGALEVLRARVRLRYRLESPIAVGREVAQWIVGASRVGAVLAAIGAAWLVVAAFTRGVEPIDLAVFAVLVRAAVDLPVRAYHAGAFALRRVYRPWPWIVILEAVGLALLLGLAPAIGAWSIGVAELAMATAFAGVAIRYAARTHRLLGLAPQRLLRAAGRRGTGGLGIGDARAAAIPALAGASMALDSLVVLAAVAAASAANEPWLALVAAALAPTFRAGFDWSQLVYFDLKRLDTPLFANLRRRLDRATLFLALLLGAILAAVGLGVAVGPLDAPVRRFWVGLPLFLAGASVLGLLLMRAFTATAYPRVIVAGAVVAAALGGLRPLADFGFAPLDVLAAAVWVAIAALVVLARGGLGDGAAREPLLPTAWLTGLRREAGQVRVGMVRIRAAEPKRGSGPLADPTALREWRAIHLARRLAMRAGRRGAASVVTGDTVLWFARDGGRAALTGAMAIAEAGGRVLEARETRAADGTAALETLAAWGALGMQVGTPTATSVADLDRQFGDQVPGGRVVDIAHGAPALGPGDRRQVLWSAVRFARSLELRPEREGDDVTAWCPDGSLQRLYVAPRTTGRRRLTRWRAILRDANLRAASGTLEPSTRGMAPSALAAPAATEFRRG